MKPYLNVHYAGNGEDKKKGQELLAKREVGCLILAGGQATRLGIGGPKGAVSITPKGHSLFSLFCKRTDGPLCIMTSPLNHQQTLDFFEKQHFFGLPKIWFFQQSMLPLLDPQLQPLPELAPDGNGHALHHFYQQGIWKEWSALGIRYLNIIPVDNFLADPFDAELVGFTERLQLDATLKGVPRVDPLEKMGALAEKEGRLQVIEYFEIPETSDAFAFSNTGMFCVSMPFIHELQNQELPIHLAKKKGGYTQVNSKVGILARRLLEFEEAKPTSKQLNWNSWAMETASNAMDVRRCQKPTSEFTWVYYKQERFLFDLLAYTRSSAALIYEKDKIYCPLKNASGEHSLETVRLKMAQMFDILN